MSQTEVKSRMYASKFPTERSPVAKCVMIAEANTDAPKSFCDAPGGTGHRDMARSESSARELGRPADAKAAAMCVAAMSSYATVNRNWVGGGDADLDGRYLISAANNWDSGAPAATDKLFITSPAAIALTNVALNVDYARLENLTLSFELNA